MHYCPLCGGPTQAGVCPVHGVSNSGQGRADPSQVFVPGSVLGGRYRIDQVLGIVGSQGTFLGVQVEGGPVLIEALGIERLARRARLLDGLFRQAQVSQRFEQQGLATILDFGVEPVSQNPFLIMALAPGRNLNEVIDPQSLERRTAAAFVEICHGLLDTHDRETLNPANAMPTQVPGMMSTQVPGVAQPILPIGPPVAPPRGLSPEPIPKDPKKPGQRRKWIIACTVAGVGIVLLAPDRSQDARYYNPDITERSLFFHGQPNRGRKESAKASADAVDLDSDPSHAEVWMGSAILGVTPLSIPRPTRGRRLSVTLKKPGYLPKSVVIQRDTDSSLEVEMHLDEATQERNRFMGERKIEDPFANPFEPTDESERFGDNPLTEPAFINPYGKPGTAPPMTTETYPTYDDDDE